MEVAEISAADLARALEDGETRVFDVNSRHKWQAAHVPGARHLDPLNFEAGELGVDPDAPIAFYCSDPTCRASHLAAARATSLGFRAVRVMVDGISGWIAAGLPVEAA